MTKAQVTEERTVTQIDTEIADLENQLENIEGTKTEVYTRIVGYYRSVANWNKGKREEYNYRKLFSEPEDMLKPGNGKTEAGVPEADADTADATAAGAVQAKAKKIAAYTLFYRETCPNCPPVKEFIAALPMSGSSIDVDTPEGMEQAMQHQVLAAPTVIFFDSRGQEISRAHNAETLHSIFPAAAVKI